MPLKTNLDVRNHGHSQSTFVIPKLIIQAIRNSRYTSARERVSSRRLINIRQHVFSQMETA